VAKKDSTLDEQGPTVAEGGLGWHLQPLRSNVSAIEQTASSPTHTVCSWFTVDAPGFYCGSSTGAQRASVPFKDQKQNQNLSDKVAPATRENL
jgi:hypothetical protein